MYVCLTVPAYQYSMLGSHGAMAIVHGSLPYEHAAVRVQRYPRELMSFLAVRTRYPGREICLPSTRVPPGYSTRVLTPSQ
jgi:hypothetical protein